MLRTIFRSELSRAISRPFATAPPRNPLTKIPLSETPSGFRSSQLSPAGKKVSSSQLNTPETKVTTLSNGIRVASEDKPGRFCTLGVIVDSGSRYEVAYPSGISHFLEKLAFGATQQLDSRDTILQILEKHGGICDCQSSRDSFIYAASVETQGLEDTVAILGEVILRPQLRPEEVEYARMAVSFELEDIDMKPDQDVLMVEAIHKAAFSDNTLGLPKICPKENVGVIDREIILKYLSQYYSPDRMVIGAVGVEHERLVEATQKYFVDAEPIWSGNSYNLPAPDHSLAQYTGGLVTIEKDLSNASLGPTPMPNLAHLSIGIEGINHQHPDFITLCVLNMLMGGGGSFSAGGPGKGMYTRLYTRVLNHFHWMYAATAFNHAYADDGLFCINSSGPPEHLSEMAAIIVHEMTQLTGDIGHEEFERAKKQLTSMLLMNLEARPVIFEDIVRQTLSQGKRKKPEHYMDLIGQVTVKDVNRVADKMLSSKPSIAAIGDLRHLPDYKQLELGLLERGNKLDPRMFTKPWP